MKVVRILILIILISACNFSPAPAPTITPHLASPIPTRTPRKTPSPFAPVTNTPAPSTHTPTALPTSTHTTLPTPSRPWRIMPLGDSLTSGNYPGRAHSYRGYLETLLHEAGYTFDLVGTQAYAAHDGSDPDSEGHSGYTIGPDQVRFCDVCSTANLYDHLEEYLQTEPDIILLLIGINDLVPTNETSIDPAKAPDKLANLVRRIQELRPEVYIFVASLAPINYMDSADLPYYDELNQMAEQLGSADPNDRIYFVDLNHSLEATFDHSRDFTDGVHLSEGGARKMAQVWFEALVASGLLRNSLP